MKDNICLGKQRIYQVTYRPLVFIYFYFIFSFSLKKMVSKVSGITKQAGDFVFDIKWNFSVICHWVGLWLFLPLPRSEEVKEGAVFFVSAL